MNFPKIIIVSEKNVCDLVIEKYFFNKIKEENGVIVFEGKREENDLVLIFSPSIISAADYILDNYLFEGIIHIGTAKKLLNFDLNEGDVVLPSVFLSIENNDKPIFLDNSIGGNYNLKKFGLILNGICLSDDKVSSNFQQGNVDYKVFEADIIDRDAYVFLSILEKSGRLENCVILKVIVESEDFDLKGSLLMLDFFV